MQVDINPVSGRIRVYSKEALERIKSRGRVRIQQRRTQPRLADLAYGYVLPIVPSVTETQFPIPILEIIAKFSHLTFEPNVEDRIPEGVLLMSGSGVANAAETNPRIHRDRDSVNIQSCIRDRERIKWILDWHTEAGRTEVPAQVTITTHVEWVGRKRNSRQGCIEKRARVLKVRKHHQVFVAQIAGERTVESLPIRRRKVWRKSREVEELIVPIRIRSEHPGPDIEWRSRGVRS